MSISSTIKRSFIGFILILVLFQCNIGEPKNSDPYSPSEINIVNHAQLNCFKQYVACEEPYAILEEIANDDRLKNLQVIAQNRIILIHEFDSLFGIIIQEIDDIKGILLQRNTIDFFNANKTGLIKGVDTFDPLRPVVLNLNVAKKRDKASYLDYKSTEIRNLKNKIESSRDQFIKSICLTYKLNITEKKYRFDLQRFNSFEDRFITLIKSEELGKRQSISSGKWAETLNVKLSFDEKLWQNMFSTYTALPITFCALVNLQTDILEVRQSLMLILRRDLRDQFNKLSREQSMN